MLCDVVQELPEQLVVREPDQELPFDVVPLCDDVHDPPEQLVVREPDQVVPCAVVPAWVVVQLPPPQDREALHVPVPRHPL